MSSVLSGSANSTDTINSGAFTLSNFFVGSTYVFTPGGTASTYADFGSGDNLASGNNTGTFASIDQFIINYVDNSTHAVGQFMAEVTSTSTVDGLGTVTADPTQYSGGNHFWEWQASTDGDLTSLPAGHQQIGVSDGDSGHSWALTVYIENPLWLGGTYGSASPAGEELLYNGLQLNADGTTIPGAPTGTGPGTISSSDGGGTITNPTVTFTGTGSASLAAVFANLSVNMLVPTDHIASEFSLTDLTTSDTTQFVEFFQSACYLAGTRIATPAGEQDIATLAIGDRVITGAGAARAIKWIGRTHHTAATIAANPHLRPVLIRRDAVAPGMPHRDLLVSPMHALYLDDAFVPAASLVNGVSILRCDERAAVSYVHIEMDEHDVVFAEGLPAETYVDDSSRQMFDNADEFYDLFGADTGVTKFSAPRIEEGVHLEAIRHRIAARAGAAVIAGSGVLAGNVERIEDSMLVGWMSDTSSSAAVELEILADGEVIGTAIANRYRPDLDFHGINGGRAGFSIALPASITSLEQVTVRRTGDGARIGGMVSAVTV